MAVDGLLVDRRLADAVEGLLHRHRGQKADELNRHDGAGAVFGVLQKLVDVGTRLAVALGEETFHDARGHLFDEVHRIVEEELIHDLFDLSVGERLQKLFLRIAVDLDEHLGRKILGQDAEEDGKIFLLHALEHFGEVDLVHRGEKRLQNRKIPLFEEGEDLFFLGDPAGDLFGHLLDDVDRVVDGDVLHDLFELIVVQPREDLLLKGSIEQDDDFGKKIAVERTAEGEDVVLRHFR